MKLTSFSILILTSLLSFAKNDRDDEVHRKMARYAFKQGVSEFNENLPKKINVILNEKSLTKDRSLEELTGFCTNGLGNAKAQFVDYGVKIAKVITSIECVDKASPKQLMYEIKDGKMWMRMSGVFRDDQYRKPAREIQTLIEYTMNPAMDPSKQKKTK